ncbi:hypothetical protein KAT84_02080 [Candidatus Bipolaricaulota bacterium]|nr:hypothetical protein [Candidatus Bipolaricaulota bacterium]
MVNSVCMQCSLLLAEYMLAEPDRFLKTARRRIRNAVLGYTELGENDANG